ncbi:sulfite exporter TauE/SafE family protein [Wielerella bovis]|uniref:sulfite exporter TauE/SafE family protein n=1 Tax=Wielerella bovis TaxID=2917790 RepID=UPI003D27B437
MIMDTTLILLILTGFAAGLMDAAVGGGGLLQLPSLFTLLPNAALPAILGTNKFSSCIGTTIAASQYAWRTRRTLPWKMLSIAALLAFIASFLGAKLAANVPVHYMKPVMLVIMAAMFVYTFNKKDFGQHIRETTLSRKEHYLGLFTCTAIGFYDGIFGPGTGSLLAFAFVRIFAFDFLLATASAKIINVVTNLAALSFFVPNGHIMWHWAIPLALANFAGGFVGSYIAIRGGTKFLRVGFMCLLVILIGKFGWDTLKELGI